MMSTDTKKILLFNLHNVDCFQMNRGVHLK